MFIKSKNPLVFQLVITGLCLGLLISCAPSEPEGVDTEGLARIGDQLHARGDDAGAIDFYARSVQHAPKDLHSRKAYAGLLEARGDNENAEIQYAEALKIAPDDGELLRDYGRVLLKLNHPEKAKEQYQKALDVDSDDIKAMNGLGVALDYMRDHAAAQAVYRKALEDHPDDIATLANIGHSYVLSGAPDEAVKLLEPHLKDKDATPAFRQNLAEAYGMAGMDADAERVARIDLPPEQVKHNLAWYRAQRKHPDATGALAANLGSFPTKGVAEAQAQTIRDRFAGELEGLNVTVMPEVKSIGSTPDFVIRVTGFEKTTQLRAFCGRLKKDGFACMAAGF